MELALNAMDAHVRLLIPYDRGDVVSRLHEEATVLSEEWTGDGALVEVRVPHAVASELTMFAVADAE